MVSVSCVFSLQLVASHEMPTVSFASGGDPVSVPVDLCALVDLCLFFTSINYFQQVGRK